MKKNRADTPLVNSIDDIYQDLKVLKGFIQAKDP